MNNNGENNPDSKLPPGRSWREGTSTEVALSRQKRGTESAQRLFFQRPNGDTEVVLRVGNDAGTESVRIFKN